MIFLKIFLSWFLKQIQFFGGWETSKRFFKREYIELLWRGLLRFWFGVLEGVSK